MSSRRFTSHAARQKPEELLQRTCVHILEHCVPNSPEGPVWTAINPVSAKSKAVAGISKSMGLRKGWPDLHILHRGKSVFIEFKADKGRVSPEQQQLHTELATAGGFVGIVQSVDQFLDVLRFAGIPCAVLTSNDLHHKIILIDDEPQ